MSMSFHEKSIWASLVAVTLVFGVYYVSVFNNLLLNPTLPIPVAWITMIGLTIFITITEILLQITAVVVSNDANQKEDERDKLIDLMAGRFSGVILGLGIMLTMLGIMGGLSDYVVIHLALSALVLAEITKLVRQIIFYRTGV